MVLPCTYVMCQKKICKDCGELKALDMYYTAKSCSDGHVGICKTCRNNQIKLRRTEIKVKTQFKVPKGKRLCKLCKETKQLTDYGISYNHKSGRNIVCKACLCQQRKDKVVRQTKGIDVYLVTRKCTSCGKTKTLSAFSKQSAGLYGRNSRCKTCDKEYYEKTKVLHPREKLVEKKCRMCENVYPVSEFYTKTTKANSVTGRKIGLLTDSISYRHVCKKCNGLQTNERKIAKRCKELGCTREMYREAYLAEQSKKMRKYPYDKETRLSNAEKARKYVEVLTDNYVLNSLRLPGSIEKTEEVKQLININRTRIKLKRCKEQLRKSQ